MNFSGNKTPVETIDKFAKSTNNIGDVQLVSSNGVVLPNENQENGNSENKEESLAKTPSENASESEKSTENKVEETSAIVSNSENNGEENKKEIKEETKEVSNSTKENTTATNASQDYFAKLKLERNEMYSKSLETYQKIVDSSSISGEQKAIAIQEIEKINKEKNAVSVAEELIKLKGFEDVVIYTSENSISVIVKSVNLAETKVAQIQNIVSRELGIDASKINISNK